MKNGATSFPRARQKGISLVELMVGLVLGLLVAAGIIQIFQSTNQTSRLQEAASRLQEGGRFAMEKLESRLRMADYSGCYGDLASGVENALNDQTNFAWQLSNPVQGFNNVAATDTVGEITGFIAGTDVLVLRGMSDSVPLASNPDANTFTINDVNNRFAKGEIMLAASCDQASLFQATDVTTESGVTTILHAAGGGMTPGNRSDAVNNRFGSDAEIGGLQTWMYYLKSGANGRPSLYEGTLVVSGDNSAVLQATELLQNVENMQMVFGVDNDGDRDADAYQDASAVANWSNVVSVRIALLLASDEDNLIKDKQSYSFNTGTFNYDHDRSPALNADKRFRRVFIGFGALRNRTL